MYRGTWLLLAVPLLLAAFSVARPTPLPAPFPPAFDTASAETLATELADFNPSRFPGTSTATGASDWFREQLEPYDIEVRSQPFTAEVPGYGRVRFENLIAQVRGRSSRRIVVTAHRDNLGIGPGANDNASGTAALIVLARSYATPSQQEDQRQGPAHTITFVSTDGGALGGYGAAHFAKAEGERIQAVVNLDAIAGAGPARLELAGTRSRSPGWTLVRTAAVQLTEQTGRAPERPSAVRQLLDLAFPFSLHEQAPFVGRGISALTITSQSEPPPPALTDTTLRQEGVARLGQIGSAAQTLIGSVDQGLEVTRGDAPYVYLGDRAIRGWAIQLVLVAALLPFLAAAVDLFARCRRRRIPLAPAVRSYVSRLGFWLFVGASFAVIAKAGGWPQGDARPIAPETDAAHVWPLGALIILGVLALAGWFVARDRLIPRRPVTVEEELAGHTAALLVLGLIAVLVVAVNAFALLFVLPLLHTWLWLPQLQARPAPVRFAVIGAGFAGPALLVWSFADRLGLGIDALAYLVALVAIGYVPLPLVVLFLALLGVAGQLGALAAGRYAPYPTAQERPPRGPLRELVRLALIAIERRRAPAVERRALEG
jgi:hypothetical protein